MKSICLFGLIVILTCSIASSQDQFSDFPFLSGPYLGQKPPGITPEIFAPGIISGELSEGCCAILKEGTVFIFRRSLSSEKGEIYELQMKNGIWSKPVVTSFKSPQYDGDFTVAPDDKTLYFSSRRATKKGEQSSADINIWKTVLTARGWSEPVMLQTPVNSDKHDAYPSVNKDGTLYLFCRDRGGYGKSDIFRTKLRNGRYSSLENMGEKINSPEHEWDPYIAPDGSYLIFCSTKSGGFGEDDIYITFQEEDGTWTQSVNMGEGINSQHSENRPSVTNDGKYLFFTSTRTGKRDIYWVDAKIIDEFKPDGLKGN